MIEKVTVALIRTPTKFYVSKIDSKKHFTISEASLESLAEGELHEQSLVALQTSADEWVRGSVRKTNRRRDVAKIIFLLDSGHILKDVHVDRLRKLPATLHDNSSFGIKKLIVTGEFRL